MARLTAPTSYRTFARCMKLAWFVALAAGLGGCGSGDNSSGTADAGSPAPVLMPLVATSAPCFGSPPGESVVRLVDHSQNTKFLGASSSLWAELDAGQLYLLRHYAITAANDAPERDPRSWLVQGSNDRSEWITLDTRINEVFATRWERREFTAPADAAFRYYRLHTENLRTNTTQIAELELYGSNPFTPHAIAPSAPSGLRATATSRTAAELQWQAGAGAEFYRIERALDGTTFETVAYVPATASSLSVAGLPDATVIAFRVVSENAAGASPPSDPATAQTLPALAGTVNGDGSFTYTEGSYSLTVHDKAPDTPAVVIRRIIDEHFAAYPAMAAAYNPNASKSVRLTFDPMYSGVAYASGSDIVISSTYAKNAPEDIDVIVHEGFHVVQAYSNPNAPGWAIEGLADFVRARYGTQNSGACWAMKRYESTQSYTNAYGVTARFLLWIEDTVRPTITTELDAALRDLSYTDAFWTAKTGKTVDELWAAYAADPARRPVSYR